MIDTPTRVLREGTCLHKLHLPAPWRYSEDLDDVRVTNTPIGPLLDELRAIGDAAGFATSGPT